MGFYDTLDKAKTLLQRQGRVSIAGLMEEFNLDEPGVGRLVEELVDVQRVAVRDGKVLEWRGDAKTEKAVAASIPTSPPLRHPQAPKHLADKILQSKSALEGERKQVTVLFADVQGSMELEEKIDPELWSTIMQRFFRILTEGVERFEGFVDKFTGDGIMALFGAPIACEDHARRACYAALHLRDEIGRYGTEVKRQYGLNFSTRIGINSGEVVVGTIGDDLRMAYTAQGHTVGLAQRMETLAEPNACFISDATAQLVSGYFTVDDLGDFDVKGATAPVRVHRLDGLGSSRTRLDVSRARGFSRFVGRGDEMHVLASALVRAKEGGSQVVGIVGDAGLGKSRLCFEFLERCRAEGLMTYETAGVAHGKTTPLVPILKLFRQFFGITDQDSATTARERIAGRLLLVDEKLRDSLAVNFDFLGYPDPDNPAPKVDAEARQRQMFDIVRRVTQARAQKETQVVLLEDLHWFDGASAAYLEPLIESAVGTRTLYVLSFRPEFRAPWMGKSYYIQLPLGPLGADAIRELLDALLGKDPSIMGLAEAIHSRTAGNPFFTEEVVQNLIETGKLQGSKGAYKLALPVSKLEVPSPVHALLAARIDRLAEREKEVLQTAAVIGREFDEPTLAAVVAQDAPQLREALQKLKDTEFVYERSLYPVTEYLFKHPLTQEVALALQLQEKRKRLHAAVAQVIEAAHVDDLDQRSALLAHHWEQSGNPAQAVRWHHRAAEWTSARDPVEGLKHWAKVRTLGSLLTDGESRESRLRACVAILANGWRLDFGGGEIRACLDEARVLATQLGRPSTFAVALGSHTLSLTTRGQIGDALPFVDEAHRMIDGSTSVRDILAVDVVLVYTMYCGGRFPQALEGCEHIIRLSNSDSSLGHDLLGLSFWIWAEAMKASVLAHCGRFEEWRPAMDRAQRLLSEHNEREIGCRALFERVLDTYLAHGPSRDVTIDVRAIASEAVNVAEEFNNLLFESWSRLALGVAYLLHGDYAESEAQLASALEWARRKGNYLDTQGWSLAVIAESRLARGDVESAISSAREGIEAADSSSAWFQAALARTVLAEALIASRAPDTEVKTAIAGARALVEKSGGNSLLPRLREAEARLAAHTDRAALLAGLHEAGAMWRSMGAPDPADRLAKELASLN